MKETIIVDVDVIIEYLKTGKGVLPTAYEKYDMQITAATNAELLASSTFEDSNLEGEVKDFVKKYFTIIDVTEDMGAKAAEVIRKSDVTFAKAITAGSAISKGLNLLTNDKKVYSKVTGLKFLEI